MKQPNPPPPPPARRPRGIPGPEGGRPAGSPWRGSWPLLLLLTLVLVWAWRGSFAADAGATLSYSEFKARLERGEVRSLVLADAEITGELVTLEPLAAAAPDPEEPAPEPPPAVEPAEPVPVPFRTVRVEDPDLVARLDALGVEYSGRRPTLFSPLLLIWFLPLLLLVLLFGVFRSAAGRVGTQFSGFGKSQARLAPEKGTGVRFDDVAGCEEAKDDLRQMVEFLRNPGRFTALGARIPKGVLLLGPPGTGKTLMARAVAGEASVPFFSISGSDFVEMFVGVGAARVRDLFVQAKQRAPCIVFIDEIDAVGRQRGVSMGVVNDEREQTLNQLLTEMDGFEVNSGVIILAATNRPEVLDRALLRPGRFDRQVVLDAPDQRGRTAILRVHARGKPIAADVDFDAVARATPGMSGADLSNALNEAALMAAQSGRDEITQRHIEDAIEKVVAGPERRSRRLGDAEKRRVAHHEAGHALVAALSPAADPVQKISIVPRGRAALGYTLQLPVEEQYLRTQAELYDRVKVMVAGRAAEELFLHEVSTGAHDDLQQATSLARHMVAVFGMSERLGLGTLARPSGGRFVGDDGAMQRDCSESTAREIDEEVRALLDRAYGEARGLLEEHRETLLALVRTLLERETMDKAAFMQVIEASTRTNGREAPAARRRG